jgi:hypothetical protein
MNDKRPSSPGVIDLAEGMQDFFISIGKIQAYLVLFFVNLKGNPF